MNAVLASKAAERVHPIRCIFRREYRPHLVMALFIPFPQQMTGINAVNFYAPIMFSTIGQGDNASLMPTMITCVISLSCTVPASLVLVDRVGRLPLYISGGIDMVVSHAVLCGVLVTYLHDQGAVSTDIAYLMMTLVSAFVAGFGWSWGPLAWLVTSKIFPLEIRSAGQSIHASVILLIKFTIAQSMLQMLCNFHGWIFFFFAGFVLMSTTFVFVLLPETNGVPLDQMGKVWMKHWYWKRYVPANTNEEDK